MLAIDPGLTRCGIGVIETVPMKLLDVHVLTTPSDTALEERLLQIDTNIREWIDRYHPDVIAIERVFSQHNVRTVMGTAQVAGLVLVAAAQRGIKVALHTPSEVKAAVTGSGRAKKDQVANMVKQILKLDAIPKPVDATDALALAICHTWRSSNRLAKLL